MGAILKIIFLLLAACLLNGDPALAKKRGALSRASKPQAQRQIVCGMRGCRPVAEGCTLDYNGDGANKNNWLTGSKEVCTSANGVYKRTP
jgi:hypothetical protein